MRILFLLTMALVTASFGYTQVSAPHPVLRVVVQGDTARLPDFVENLRREFAERGMALSLVNRDTDHDYNIVLAQESSLGGAAAAVVVLDAKAVFVTSVVRSGRATAKGAFNATAKELAKKIAILRGVPTK